VTDLLAAIASTRLRGGSAVPWPSAPLADEPWKRLLRRVEEERLEGLLLAAANHPGPLPANARQRSDAHDASVAACGLAVRLERRAADAVAVLGAAGVDSRVLKGTAVAQLDYPYPSLRHHGDVDLLVPTAAFGDAVAALRADGWSRPGRPARPGWYRRFGKALVLRDPAGLEVDLHRTLADGAPGVWVVQADLWRAGEAVELDGRPVTALSLELRFVHACLHAALGAWPTRWAALRDVAQLGLDPSLDLAEVASVAERWRATLTVTTAVQDAWAGLRPLAPAPDLRLGGRRPRAERIALALERDHRRGHRRRLVSTLGALQGASAKAAFVRTASRSARPAVDVSRRRRAS
jgi:Uncharacterised nucleotidyltransferase